MLRRSLVLALLPSVAFAAADVPIYLHHAGRLVEGDDVPVQAERTLTFSLFERDTPPATGTETAVWTDSFLVHPKDGLYTVLLGSHTAFEPSDFAGLVYLEVKVGETRLLPRLPIGQVPSALLASKALEAEHAAHADLATKADRATNADDADKLGGKSLADLGDLFAPKSGGTGYVALQSGDVSTQSGGIVVDGRVKAGSFEGNGSTLTALDASKLATGTLADGLLAGTYAQKTAFTNAQNAFSGAFTGDLAGNVTGNTAGTHTGPVQNGQLKGTTVLDPVDAAPSGTCTLGQVSLTKAGELWVCTTGSTWRIVGRRPGQISWVDATKDFGTVTLASAAQTLTLKNVGDEAVTGLSLRMPEGFNLDSTTCTATLAGGATCTASVSFLAQGEKGDRVAYLDATTASGGAAALKVTGKFVPPGGAAANAAVSCKAIKTAWAEAADGVYWVNPNGGAVSAAFQVFCEMSTDGGGWTFFAHLNNSTVNSYNQAIFSANLNTYNTGRTDGAITYSKGASILPYIGHTELMITIDTNNPAAANLSNKLVTYKYAANATSFNQGGGTCTGSSPFTFRLDLDGPYVATTGTGWYSCTASNWYPASATTTATYLSLMGAGNTQTGVYWGAGMGGNGSWGHDAYFYAR